jgi:DNA-damage-inducible protein J
MSRGADYMALVTTTIRMDADVKRSFDQFCANVGMTASTAFNVFARAVLRERHIPFEIMDEDEPLVREGFVVPEKEKNDP